MLTFQEENVEPQRLPQRKTAKSKHGKTASKPSRILFEENSLPEAAACHRTSELLPSPSQIDPEFLAALPDDVRQEIEQAYKQKESLVTRAHAQARPPADRVLEAPSERRERNTMNLQAGDIQRKEGIQVIAPPKQVHCLWLDF